MTVFGKVILGILLLIVAGGVYYGVTLSVKNDVSSSPVSFGTTTVPLPEVVSATTTASTTTAISSTTSDKPASKKMAFSEFIKQGGAYKCAVTQTVATMTTAGTVYLDS